MKYYIITKYNKRQAELLYNADTKKWIKRPEQCKKPLDCNTCKTCKFITRFKYKKDAKAELKNIQKEKQNIYLIWREEARHSGFGVIREFDYGNLKNII